MWILIDITFQKERYCTSNMRKVPL